MREALALVPSSEDIATFGVLIDLDLCDVPTHEYLSSIVGGWLEYVHLADDLGAYIDEEGKLKGLPLNPVATILYQTLRDTDDVIVGNALLVGPPDSEGDETSLSETWVNRLLTHLGSLEVGNEVTP